MAAARLNHPNMVTIYSADVYDGRPAIVMELVEGATFSDLLRPGPLEPNAAVDALDQLLEAAAYAHSMGVVHRAPRPVTTWRWDARGSTLPPKRHRPSGLIGLCTRCRMVLNTP